MTDKIRLRHFGITYVPARGRRDPCRTQSNQSMKLDKVFTYLQNISWGRVELTTPEHEVHSFGNNNEGPEVGVVIRDPSFLRRLIPSPSIAVGDSYVAGQWDITRGRLVDLFGIIWAHPDNRPDPRWLR